jgi:hypothetical protein
LPIGSRVKYLGFLKILQALEKSYQTGEKVLI